MDLKALAPLSSEGVSHNHKRTYAYGAAAAHVAVDPRTGEARVDYVTVEDIGRIINPLTATGQAIGAVVQGLGGVFLEELQYDEHEDSPSPINPFGAKGGGEGGIVPVGSVVANAVAPLGAVPRSLPLSPPKIWHLLQNARK